MRASRPAGARRRWGPMVGALLCLAVAYCIALTAAPPRGPAVTPAQAGGMALAVSRDRQQACAWVVGPGRQHCPPTPRARTTGPRGREGSSWLLVPPLAAAVALVILGRRGRR
ncbi:hypothetical protein C9F11_43435 (plasmid) [Streptomyces sp. YIM 121038]|uniref:hypothetical protein n=1 Tax=Streptomyces sp. YIM 121038 TaxID=2136401 RepID=UPI0011101A38|nr:hypothetical protein [Streptomyces sp. YIM 121038]QCX82267.1 hypothetical protein C9F11_43435 [Streptomyces sp. YIM 121038]